MTPKRNRRSWTRPLLIGFLLGFGVVVVLVFHALPPATPPMPLGYCPEYAGPDPLLPALIALAMLAILLITTIIFVVYRLARDDETEAERV